MEEKNLCLDCKLAVWIKCKADLGKLPRSKRKEFEEELAKIKLDHGVELSEIIFPFIWCPEWKKEQLFPFENVTLGCKYYQEIKEGSMKDLSVKIF
ncbi:hypothetical protein ES703_69868 [subsurface metagenome]